MNSISRLLPFRRAGRGSTFQAAAAARRVPSSVVRMLERAASQLAPDEPERVLESRELFEAAAFRAILANGSNLELSYRIADRIAGVVDQLGLARATDLPDPFRRVWVADAGSRRQAVVLSHGHDEVAVICPRGVERVKAGATVRLSYRGVAARVDFELQVSDAVALPHGLVLHLVRLDGHGSIGRSSERYAVHFRGEVRGVDDDLALPCEILDFSSGGLRLEGGVSFERGDTVAVAVALRDGNDEPLQFHGEVRWTKELSASRRGIGVQFAPLEGEDEQRLLRFLKGQALGFTRADL